MANADTPRGFSATGCQYGLEPVSVDSGNGTAFFRGDVTSAQNDGSCTPSTAGDVVIIGIANSSTTATTAAKTILAASTAGTIMVHQDPMQQFVVQGASGTAGSQTLLFNGMNHVAGSGSTVTGLSGHELDLSDAGASTGGFVLLDYVLRDDNEEDAANVDCVVRLNVGEGILTIATGV